MKAAGFNTVQAYEDAYILIVKTAIEAASETKPTIIVAEDIDLLVILTLRVYGKKYLPFETQQS